MTRASDGATVGRTCAKCGQFYEEPEGQDNGCPHCARSAAKRQENGGRMDSPDHIAAPGMWSYACPCLRCRWEAWWNEGDNYVVAMPDEPHPDGEFLNWFKERDQWSGSVHPNEH